MYVHVYQEIPPAMLQREDNCVAPILVLRLFYDRLKTASTAHGQIKTTAQK